jgi:hypothetical protein
MDEAFSVCLIKYFSGLVRIIGGIVIGPVTRSLESIVAGTEPKNSLKSPIN